MEDVLLIVRVMLGGVFLVAALSKLSPSPALEDAVRRFSFGLFTVRQSQVVARLLPVFELGLGLTLIFGILLKAVAVVASAALMIFTISMTANLARGNRFTCNCFGDSSAKISYLSLCRNLVLMMLALFLTVAAPWEISLLASLHSDLLVLEDPDFPALLLIAISLSVGLIIMSQIDTLPLGVKNRL